jgi:hypothetical protein
MGDRVRPHVSCPQTTQRITVIITTSMIRPHGLFRLRIKFSEFMNLWSFVRTPWAGDQPDARPLPTQDNTTQKNADTYPCLKEDTNAGSQCLSDRRQYVPYTARPLGPAHGLR